MGEHSSSRESGGGAGHRSPRERPRPSQQHAPAMVLMAALQVVVSYRHYLNPNLAMPLKLVGLVSDLATGALVGLGVLAAQRAYRERSLGELMPGHWLALAQLLYFAGQVLALFLQGHVLVIPGLLAGDSGEFVMRFGVNGVGAVLFVFLAVQSRESTPWRVYAGLTAVLFLVYLGKSMIGVAGYSVYRFVTPYFVSQLMMTGMVVLWTSRTLFLFALIRDHRERTIRDRSHWLGVALAAGLAVLGQVLPFMAPYPTGFRLDVSSSERIVPEKFA